MKKRLHILIVTLLVAAMAIIAFSACGAAADLAAAGEQERKDRDAIARKQAEAATASETSSSTASGFIETEAQAKKLIDDWLADNTSLGLDYNLAYNGLQQLGDKSYHSFNFETTLTNYSALFVVEPETGNLFFPHPAGTLMTLEEWEIEDEALIYGGFGEGFASAISEFLVNTPDGSNLNMREGPGTEYGIIMKIPDGEVVYLFSGDYNSDEWVEVEYVSGPRTTDVGWVSSEFLLPITDERGVSSGKEITADQATQMIRDLVGPLYTVYHLQEEDNAHAIMVEFSLDLSDIAWVHKTTGEIKGSYGKIDFEGMVQREAAEADAFAALPDLGSKFEWVEAPTIVTDGLGLKSVTGVIRNISDSTILFTGIAFNGFDMSGNQIGSAEDSISNLGAGNTWKFEAPFYDDSIYSCEFIGIL